MPSLGRKFLLAGMGGLNLTHAKPFDNFVTRYAGRRENTGPLLRRFDPQALREWSTASASRPSSAARAASFRPT